MQNLKILIKKSAIFLASTFISVSVSASGEVKKWKLWAKYQPSSR